MGVAISGGAGFLSSSANLVVHRFSCTEGGGRGGKGRAACVSSATVVGRLQVYLAQLQ